MSLIYAHYMKILNHACSWVDFMELPVSGQGCMHDSFLLPATLDVHVAVKSVQAELMLGENSPQVQFEDRASFGLDLDSSHLGVEGVKGSVALLLTDGSGTRVRFRVS